MMDDAQALHARTACEPASQCGRTVPNQATHQGCPINSEETPEETVSACIITRRVLDGNVREVGLGQLRPDQIRRRG